MERSWAWGLCLLLAAPLTVLGLSPTDGQDPDISLRQAELAALASRLQNDPALVAQLHSQRDMTSPTAHGAEDRREDQTSTATLGDIGASSGQSQGNSSSSDSDSSDSDSSDSRSSDSRSSDSDSSDSDSSDSKSSDSDSSDSDSSYNDSSDIDKQNSKHLSPQDLNVDTAGDDLTDKGKLDMDDDDIGGGGGGGYGIRADNHDEEGNFPCPRHFPSPYDRPPRSVHQLMPGDISVVAALGDSLTAARGAGVRSFMAMLFDYRGLSWSIGGDGSYHDFTSLPNILREYNPDLYGFSNGRDEDSPGLNVAVTAATSNNLVAQTKRLIRKMQNDPSVEFEKDWKVITIFIGGNDVCRVCLQRRLTAENFAANLKDSLDMLQEVVPRAFVNVVELMKVEMAVEIVRQNDICENALSLLCACMALPKDKAAFERNLKIREAFQKAAEDVVNSGDYDRKEDFTVVLQPFYKYTDPPKKTSKSFTKTSSPMSANAQPPVKMTKTNRTTDSPIPVVDYEIDLSYFAADCFHYSRKGQASAGLNLFNNMLEPVGHKSTRWTGADTLRCPTSQFPYFATRNNSVELLKHWRGREPVDARTEISPDHRRQDAAQSVRLEGKTHSGSIDGDPPAPQAVTARGQSGHTADPREDRGTDGEDDMGETEPDGSLAPIAVALLAVSIGLVGLAGFYIHRRRGKSNLYVRIL